MANNQNGIPACPYCGEWPENYFQEVERDDWTLVQDHNHEPDEDGSTEYACKRGCEKVERGEWYFDCAECGMEIHATGEYVTPCDGDGWARDVVFKQVPPMVIECVGYISEAKVQELRELVQQQAKELEELRRDHIEAHELCDTLGAPSEIDGEEVPLVGPMGRCWYAQTIVAYKDDYAKHLLEDARGPVPLATLAVTLPIPPSTNNAYFTSKRHGRRVLSEQGKAFKLTAIQAIRAAAQAANWREIADSRLALTLTLHFPNKRRRDLSNCIKLAEDALAEALGFDDSRIDDLHIVRNSKVDRDNPRAVLTLAILPGKGEG